jgi:Pretoxin HINT domain
VRDSIRRLLLVLASFVAALFLLADGAAAAERTRDSAAAAGKRPTTPTRAQSASAIQGPLLSLSGSAYTYVVHFSPGPDVVTVLGGMVAASGVVSMNPIRPGYDAPSSLREKRTSMATKAGPCSFGGETRVLLADGSTKPISQVEVGDMVLAQDPETGEIGARKVTDAWVHDDDLVRLEIDGDVVRTTEDHPFWNDTDKHWQRADQLNSGDYVLTAEGRRVKVGVLIGSAGRGSAYNFTVEGLHIYHVLFGSDAVLVHNACGEYQNPGTHDPNSPNYVASKSVLPSNADTLFAQSVEVNGVRWTKVGTGNKAVYHRFANDGQGNWHWNGSTDGVTNAGNSNVISPNNVPVAVKRS